MYVNKYIQNIHNTYITYRLVYKEIKKKSIKKYDVMSFSLSRRVYFCCSIQFILYVICILSAMYVTYAYKSYIYPYKLL